MKQNCLLRGRVWKFGDNINTDLIMPGSVIFLSEDRQKKAVFESIRPGWSQLVREGDMIIGGGNFGTGSSRPAAKLLRALGIVAVVAESVNGLFLRSCLNYGVVAFSVRGISDMFQEGEAAEIDPYLSEIRHGSRRHACLTGEKLPESLIDLALSGGIMSLLEKEGYLLKRNKE